jgi:hypothetical protein
MSVQYRTLEENGEKLSITLTVIFNSLPPSVTILKSDKAKLKQP